MKLSEFYEGSFLPYCDRLRRSTVVGYESAWRCHIEPRFGEVDLSDIDVESVELWLASFERTGAARKAYAVLRAMLRKAFKWQHVAFDPTVLQVDIPRHQRYRPEVLSDREITDVLRAFHGHEVEPVVLCSVTLGLRRGESCGLTWGDIDLRSGRVSITRSRQYVGGEVRVEGCKTDLSERVLMLPRFALERLRELAKGRDKGEFLCTLSPDAVARKYKAHCRRKGLPYVSLKNLRHSYATSMLRAGVDVTVVSRMLGHSKVDTTARYYLVPDLKLFRKAQGVWEARLLKSAREVDVT